MNVRIESSWQQRLQSEFDKPYFENLTAFVRHEYATKTVYPPGSQIFAAFDACPFDQVKVVILGQDPYHAVSYTHLDVYKRQPEHITVVGQCQTFHSVAYSLIDQCRNRSLTVKNRILGVNVQMNKGLHKQINLVSGA